MDYKITSRSEDDTRELAENIESEKFAGDNAKRILNEIIKADINLFIVVLLYSSYGSRTRLSALRGR